jgi:bifunctional non-homologous end joining protein LigD
MVVEFMIPTRGAPFSRAGWIFELKYDGYRMLGLKEPSGVRLVSRNRHEATTWFPEAVEALQALPGRFLIDAEACVLDERGIPDFERLRKRAARRGRGREDAPVTLLAFDLLAVNGRDIRGWPLLRRKARLRKLIPPSCVGVGYVDFVPENGLDLYRQAVAAGMEGVVGKRADSPYVGGETLDWIKSKPKGFHDLGWKRKAVDNITR